MDLSKISLDRPYLILQSTPDKANLQGKSSYRELEEIAGSKEKNSFYCTVNILITVNWRNVE